MRIQLLAFLMLALGRVAFAQSPAEAIDKLVVEAIAAGKTPGVVLRVQRGGCVLLEKAWGNRAVAPAPEPADLHTIYDLASLTKPVATSTAIAILVDQGKLKWTDPVGLHWPDFAAHGKERVTLENLLLHTSGLIADNPIGDYLQGQEKALKNIANLGLVSPLGSKFRYSDVNFIVLGVVVQRVSGQPLDQFCATHLFGPLGMSDTSFNVKEVARAAPTQQRDGGWMRGQVHDPRAFLLGGVAGHAGLFSTAANLAVYARMVLANGRNPEKAGQRILSAKTCQEWIQPRPVPGGHRAYGWDVDTAYSSNRGELFPRLLSFGHTGFTGTSIWIDPVHDAFQIFLANRVHPSGKGDVQRLRGQVATQAARLLMPTPPTPEVRTGLAVLAAGNFAQLKDKKIGIITNHTGRDARGVSVVDLLHKAPGVTVKVLFGPEHGIRGAVDKPVGDSVDPATNLPVASLYGPRRKPTREQLAGLDLLVFDIQDAGCRFYTYSSTLGLIMEAAAEAGVEVLVLDRPNPIGGLAMAGPLTDPGAESFVAFHRLPTRHGLTLGELARLYALERHGAGKLFPPVKLKVVAMEGWTRGMTFEATGLEWLSPSPNLRSLPAALFYPGVGLLEFTNLSVGRGTDRPFEWVGAPWLEPHGVIARLRAMRISGMRFMATSRTPSSSVFANKPCPGIDLVVENLAQVDPLQLGIGLALALREVHGEIWQVEKMEKLLVNQVALGMIREKKPLPEILASFQPGLEEFKTRRDKVLLYP